MTESLTQFSRELAANATQLLTPRQAAELLHTTYGNLNSWRHNRRHPLAYVRIGRKIYYRIQDIERFIEASVQPGDGPKSAEPRNTAGRK